jgi:hypothetical protein
MHHDPQFYRIRNHLVDFLGQPLESPAPTGTRKTIPLVYPGEDARAAA